MKQPESKVTILNKRDTSLLLDDIHSALSHVSDKIRSSFLERKAFDIDDVSTLLTLLKTVRELETEKEANEKRIQTNNIEQARERLIELTLEEFSADELSQLLKTKKQMEKDNG